MRKPAIWETAFCGRLTRQMSFEATSAFSHWGIEAGIYALGYVSTT
jgi:hypothetical protein